jgi:hypothetical protein
VIVVSDEREQSGQTWDTHLDAYRTLVPDVVVSGVLDVNTACGEGAQGYVDAVEATGGALLDICGDWGSRVDELLDPIAVGPARLSLAEPPIDGTIAVTVGGSPVGFSWDEAAQQIVLDEILPPGTAVDVTWATPGTCAL